MNQDIKRSIILEHYQNPINRGLIENDEYIKINMNNESCIDEIDLMVKLNNNIIEDIRFDGEACAISTSSTSIMINTLMGKTIEEAKNIINNYYNMIEEKDYDPEILGEAVVYEDIYRQPNRKKCALLSWWGIERVVRKCQNEK